MNRAGLSGPASSDLPASTHTNSLCEVLQKPGQSAQEACRWTDYFVIQLSAYEIICSTAEKVITQKT